MIKTECLADFSQAQNLERFFNTPGVLNVCVHGTWSSNEVVDIIIEYMHPTYNKVATILYRTTMGALETIDVNTLLSSVDFDAPLPTPAWVCD